MKKALITGITGQDGSYLAEFLLEKGYEVHGIVRRSSLINTHRIDHIYEKINLHYGDLTDSTNLVKIIQQIKPEEIYNLGAQSHVKVSFEMPEYTGSKLMDWEHFVFLKQFVFLDWRSIHASIRHLQVNCMVLYKRLHKQRRHRSTHALLMV